MSVPSVYNHGLHVGIFFLVVSGWSFSRIFFYRLVPDIKGICQFLIGWCMDSCMLMGFVACNAKTFITLGAWGVHGCG